jgi:membrane-bound lytic murein transglycosylase D
LEAKPAVAKNDVLLINGIMAMKVHSGESVTSFVKRAGVDLSYFLKCNDLSISDKLIAGDFYYLKRKKTKAGVPQHMVKTGDNLWSISQQYGVQLHKLRKYNNTSTHALSEGSIVYLSSKKGAPKKNQETIEVAEVDSESAFNWAIEPEILETSIRSAPLTSVVLESNAMVNNVDSAGVERVILRPDQHTVSAGETLYSIAKHYQVGVMEIVHWNNLKLEEDIKPGQVLSLQLSEEKPQSTVVQPTEITHTVKSSDTLYSIARQYGVTIKELMDWNQKTDFALSVGESLKILKR